MLSYNFIWSIALDSLGSIVPTGYMAFRVQHVDSVVGNTFNKQFELLLASPERIFSFLALSKVSSDFGKSQKPP